MREIKIAMLSDCAMQNTGYATITRNLLNGLSERGFKCVNFAHSFAGQSLNKVEFEDGNKIDFKIWGTGAAPFYQDILQQKLKEFKADVLIILLDTFMCYPWLLSMDLSPAKTIFYYPHDGGAQLPENCEKVLKKVDKAIGMAKYGRDEAKNHYGIDAGYIPHAVHHNLYKPYTEEQIKSLKESYGLQGKFVVGTVARNQSRKMMDRTFTIFKEFAEDHDDAVLFLHTDPNDVAQVFDMNSLIKRYGLQNKVKFSGMRYFKGFDYNRMPDVYNLMDVFILTTSGEGFGVPIIEAMSCGVPCLVTDATTTKELVLDHKAGLGIDVNCWVVGSWNVDRAICDIKDGVEKLDTMYVNYKNEGVKPSLWNKWKKNGRKAVLENYTWDSVINDWVSEIENLLEIDYKISDEFYFKYRNLETKHYEDAMAWKEFFKPNRVVMFGVGKGPRVYTLNRFGVETEGFEISDYAVDNSFAPKYKNVGVNKGDILDCPEHAKGDLVVAYDLLEHIEYVNLDKAINQLIASTNKHILVSIPYKGTFNCDNDPTHIIKEEKKWWNAQFLSKGLKQIEVPNYFPFKEQLMIFEVQ